MRGWWIVTPDDNDIEPRRFETKRDAQDWADGLPCGYIMEHV